MRTEIYICEDCSHEPKGKEGCEHLKYCSDVVIRVLKSLYNHKYEELGDDD